MIYYTGGIKNYGAGVMIIDVHNIVIYVGVGTIVVIIIFNRPAYDDR